MPVFRVIFSNRIAIYRETVMKTGYVLAIDQGTTSTRAAIFNELGQCLASAAREFRQHYPQPGWVEHDPQEIWQTVAEVVPLALSQARINARRLAAIGLTNQRETVVLWDRENGQPVAPAIVWQDRRTASFCRDHKNDEPWVFERTGLVLDPYFSATKIRWLLENDASVKARAEAGRLAVGTIDSWLLWNLTAGKVHATDTSNASRTLLVNLATAKWDAEFAVTSRFHKPCCRRFSQASIDSGSRRLCHFYRRVFPSQASPAISRRRYSARAASRNAKRSAPTAPARSFSRTRAKSQFARSIDY